MPELLGRMAHVLDATGIVVWLGSRTGADLRPMATYGYSAAALARLPPVPRAANNAAAAAFRTGTLQIVLACPGVSPGALVAPLLSPDGCVGALSAEIPAGGETADSTQALVSIFAAELALALVAPSEAQVNRSAAG